MIKLGVVIDPIEHLHPKKDSTIAMLWEAKARGWQLYELAYHGIYWRDETVYANARQLSVTRDEAKWYQLDEVKIMALGELDIILMRKDPPFDLAYIYITYLLEHAERAGVLVVNKPQALRDVNEKFFTTYFPQCCPPMLVTQEVMKLQQFVTEQQDIVCKPLDGMGGSQVFRVRAGDVNATAIFDVLTDRSKRLVMAQRFIPDIVAGDKRILLVNGDPIPYALARIPQAGDWRGNLAVGARGVAQPLTERDYWISAEVGPLLREQGLYFVGLDVIGEYLTEINVTSPTGIRELDAQCGLNISSILLDYLENRR